MSICISKGTCIAFLSKNCNRPVSLCNVVYKIISKLLVAKLRPLLDKIISLAQLAFITNRWIADLMAIKLDLQKAYDRVSWRFIQAVLLHLGFNQTFTGWIISCISSVSFEVLINGGKTESFKLGRDLRQGDPL